MQTIKPGLKLPHEIKREHAINLLKTAAKATGQYLALSAMVAIGAYTLLGMGGLL